MVRFIVAALVVVAISTLALFQYLQAEDTPPLMTDDTWKKLITELGPEAARREYATFIIGLNISWQHANAHEYGRALYALFGLQGVAFCADREGIRGCFHEILAADALATGDENDSRCIAEQNVLARTECEHALGHGFVARYGYTQEGLDRSFARCEEIRALEDVQGCAYGVIMEWYLRFVSGEPQLWPRDQGAIALCESLSGISRSACFYNIALVWFNEVWELPIRDAFAAIGAWCESLEGTPRDRSDCGSGLGRTIASRTEILPDEKKDLCHLSAADATISAACESVVTQYASGVAP